MTIRYSPWICWDFSGYFCCFSSLTNCSERSTAVACYSGISQWLHDSAFIVNLQVLAVLRSGRFEITRGAESARVLAFPASVKSGRARFWCVGANSSDQLTFSQCSPNDSSSIDRCSAWNPVRTHELCHASSDWHFDSCPGIPRFVCYSVHVISSLRWTLPFSFLITRSESPLAPPPTTDASHSSSVRGASSTRHRLICCCFSAKQVTQKSKSGQN